MKIPILGKRFVAFSSFKPNGKCYHCDKVLIGRQRKYCSNACVHEFLIRHNWEAFRFKVIKERGKKCEDCGVKEGKVIGTRKGRLGTYDILAELQVHHIKRIVDGGELCPDDPNAVRVVCRKCHGIRHRKDK